jgi:nicotinamidase-related amidase
MSRSAVVICDMWDTHHCISAARRVAEMAPVVNAVIANLRAQRTLIIHAPHGCMEYYRRTPGRQRAIEAPYTQAPVPFDWNPWNAEREASLPTTLTNPGPCSCDSPAPCNTGGLPYPWTHQSPAIDIAPVDVISDDGQEVFNVLAATGVQDVIVMGVHTNICVLSRPYGIRQLVCLGKRPVLCRDLTDSFHRDPRGHVWGTVQMIAHIERHWCPTVTSADLLDGSWMLSPPS